MPSNTQRNPLRTTTRSVQHLLSPLSGEPCSLVSGKFTPFHAGHAFLLETALSGPYPVTVAVYDSPAPVNEKWVPVRERAAWIREMYPDVQVITVYDPPLYRLDAVDHDLSVVDTQPAHQADIEISSYYAGLLRRVYRRPVAQVYSSEPYGETFAQALDAEHVLVDATRQTVPVSGTVCRRDPHLARSKGWIDPVVYASYVQKICVVGGESTGKTTLAKALAQRLNTLWVSEYGREWVETHGECQPPDLLHIAQEHYRREELALRDPSVNGYLVCDTNPVVTEFWSRFYYSGWADQALCDIAQNVQDDYLYILCGDEIAFNQDGTRESEHLGRDQHIAVMEDLMSRGIAALPVWGSVQKRLDQIEEWLASFSV